MFYSSTQLVSSVRQPSRFSLCFLLLAVDNAFATKLELGPQGIQLFDLIELGVNALAQGLALQVAQNKTGFDELAVGLWHVGQVVLPRGRL